MHQSTALGPLYSHAKTKSTSSMKSVMNTHLISTAHERRNRGRVEGVLVILAAALASSLEFSCQSAANCAVHHRLRRLLVSKEVGHICRLPA
jgi:hypothetical protein